MLDSLDTIIAFALIMLVVSLLITIAVQMISSALNLRGLNLAKGLTETLKTVAPGQEEQARVFANHLLTGPMISDSSFVKWWPSVWRLATAVRPHEVFDAIHRIAIGRREAPDDLRNYAKNLLIALGMNKGPLDASAKEISAAGKAAKSVTNIANDVIAVLPDKNLQRELQEALAEVTNQLAAYATAEASRLAQAGIVIAGAVDDAYQRFEYWSEVCQERAQQWFSMHTRFLTVIFAIIFAFCLQLDTVDIFKLVSTNRTVRDRLVARATTVSANAERILSSSKSVLEEARSALIATEDDTDIKKALESVTVEDSDTRESLYKRLNAKLTAAPGKGEKLASDFDAAVNDAATTRLNNQAGDFRAVKADLDQTGFDLIPTGSNGRWGKGWSDVFSPNHFFGILFSVALLSLGAPFWFNILKSLTNLRSSVAQNISDEKKQAGSQPDSTSSGNPPPTTVPPR
jgi:hypothetical protein